MATFNPNEVVLERVRSMIFKDLVDGKLLGRLTQLGDPSLQVSAEGEDIVDATGSTIMTLYKAAKGVFTASNSVFSLDLAALQFGTTKNIASSTNLVTQAAEEMLEIKGDKVTLAHTPSNTIKYVYMFNNKKLGEALTADATAGAGKFSISDKEITFAAGTEGRVYIEYTYTSQEAVEITKNTENFPEAVACTMFVKFRDVCNENIKYYGSIIAQRAKLDPSQVELALSSTGKHAFTVNFNKDYCDDDADLFSIVVTAD